MNERSLVNKVIALLSFGQTQVVASFRFDVQTILFAFQQRLESQLEMPVFVVVLCFFLKFDDENFVLFEYGIEIDLFFLTATIQRCLK